MKKVVNFLDTQIYLFKISKTIKLFVLILIVALMVPLSAFSQKDDDPIFAVYTYDIKPEMVKAEEAFVKELIETLKKYGLDGPTWSTATTNTNRYLYIVALKNMAQLDKKPWQPLIDKMGEAKWKQLIDKSKGHESVNSSHVSILDSELSYMPNGLSTKTPGQEFRAWNIFHIKPGMYDKAKEIGKKIKAVYQSKNSNYYYRIYHNKFGGNGNTFVVVSSHENMGDYYQKSQATQKLLGKEVEALYDEFLTCVAKQERQYGKMRPDLSNN